MRLFASILLALTALGYFIAEGFDGILAFLMAGLVAGAVIYVVRWAELEVDYLINVFLLALSVRLALGLFIHVYDLREFFGGDALGFDKVGELIVGVWSGEVPADTPLAMRTMSTSNPGFGIHYLIAAIYYVLGPNILAAQSFSAAVGAAISPLLFYCSSQMFNNSKISKIAALFAALFPAFVVWTSQLLKDGFVIFFLVLTMTMVMVLQKRIHYVALMVLVLSLFGIVVFRFYIFYMVMTAVVGSLVIGRKTSVEGFARGLALIVFSGLALTYLGVTQTVTENAERYVNFEQLQRSRTDLAVSADSGFGGDVDVSNAQGAISTIPTGFVYLMFAPFPWEAQSLRQSVTIPETILWWLTIPLIVFGIGFSLRHRLRAVIPVLIFTVMLTLAYSVFQGNVGTAYRQRTQIQVFLFIFIGVGGAWIMERRENEKIIADANRRKFEEGLRRHLKR